MDSAYISAIAALAGSVIGGLTSLSASWISHIVQARTQQILGDKTRRQKLYKVFIEEASKLYADALTNDKAEVTKLIDLYALTSRMRVLSSPPVVEGAETVVQLIIETYFEPNKTLHDLRDSFPTHKLDLLRNFSEACRAEDLPGGRQRRSRR
jgi:hypothetical protein